MIIKDIPKENRPRERFQKLGAAALSDAELLAIILQKGTIGENVIDMCNRLISRYGVDKLSELSLKELQEIKGIGPAKAMQIMVLFEFSKRYALDSKNKIIKDEIISTGILNASLVHPREVFKSAIKESANAIILVHNHPSGDPTPSEEDKRITKILFDAGKFLDIKLLDHVIIGDTYYSFKEKGEI